jgi:hypothetical protein
MMRFDQPPGAAPAGPAAPGRSPLSALTEAIAAATGEGPPPVATPAPAPAARAKAASRLGALSERYESGGRGPGTVSSGLRDPGGVSYGLYQFASKTGTVAAFLAAEGVRWSARFIGKAPGTAPFSAIWQDIAAREPALFAEAQHGFIERSHYRPAVAAVKTRTGLDLDQRAQAVRDACWSCAVQHGAAATILTRAVTATDAKAARTAAGYDRALVNAIYDARSDYVRKLAADADAGTRRTFTDLVNRRYPDERARALAMLAG